MQRSSKLVSFLDLAGHARYLKTTLSGMVRSIHACTDRKEYSPENLTHPSCVAARMQ